MSELEPCCNSDCGDYEMEDKMNELEPCPFCGTSVVGIEHDGLYRWVECGNMDCNAAGKVFTFLIDADADHIVANNWNTRPIEDELRAELARRDEKIAELLKVYGECKDAIARRDEVIRKLKEDGERLFSGLKDFDGTRGWKICKFCHAEMEFVDHAPDCPITLHRALMKELE